MTEKIEASSARKPLRILVYGINFSPELTGIGKYTGEMTEWLAARGHEVRVVTAPPYYPAWKVAPGYRRWFYSRQQRGSVDVWRAPMYVPGKPGGISRVAHLLSYSMSSIPLLLAQLRWRPDVVWVAQPTLFCVPGALALTRLTGSKRWIHVQDFEVNAGFGLGLMKGSRLRRIVLEAESWLFRRFDRISTISPNMCSLAREKTGRDDVVLFPNWVDTRAIRPLDRPSAFRERLDIRDDEIVLLYSGVMAQKQGLDVLADAASQLQGRTEFRFVFCGNGPARAALEQACSGLTNVSFLNLQPEDQLGELLGLADIHLLPQRADISDLVMPSKLTGMLASGRPVIATVQAESSLADMLSGCGVVVPPEDAGALADAIVRLADDRAMRRVLGHTARDKAHRYLSQDAILRSFEQTLQDLCDGPVPAVDGDTGVASVPPLRRRTEAVATQSRPR